MKLINIGFGNMVAAGRLIAIVSPDSAPIKRMVQEARDRGVLIDATDGRRTRAVLIMDNDHLVPVSYTHLQRPLQLRDGTQRCQSGGGQGHLCHRQAL